MLASYFCSRCQERAAGIDILAVALQVVNFSDEEFFDAQLREHFAENAKRVALQGFALWPGSNFEVGYLPHANGTVYNSLRPGRHLARPECLKLVDWSRPYE